MDIKVSFLVLDFLKPQETRNCLESIKKYALFPNQVIYLDNGGFDVEYPNKLYQEGLCDILIRNKEGTGCGNGTVQLFNACDTEWAIYLQNDQELCHTITEESINEFINVLERNKDIGYIDMAGAQCGKNNYSERAGFINVEFYKQIPKGEHGKYGGPGPWNHIRYTENYVQEYFKNNHLDVVHLSPVPVRDCGKWSIRKIGDGLYQWRTDTKQLWVLQTPTYKTEIWPPFNNEEWDKVLNGEWENGSIPFNWGQHSFEYWKN